MDVGEHSTLRDGDTAQELVEFLVVPDGELDVARDDAGALVVLGGVSGEFEQLGGEVLEDGGHVDRSSRADTLGETSLTKVSSHAANGELEPGPGGSCGGLTLLFWVPAVLETMVTKTCFKGTKTCFSDTKTCFSVLCFCFCFCCFFFSSRRRHTRLVRDWSSDVCSSDLGLPFIGRSSLAKTLVNGSSLVPSPAKGIIACLII